MSVLNTNIKTCFILFVLAVLFTESCRKKDLLPAGNGSISGVVNPAEGAVQVIAVRDTLRYTAVPGNDGKFVILNLPPGNYTITAVSDTGFYSSTPASVSLQVGQHIDIGKVSFSSRIIALVVFTMVPVQAVSSIKITSQAFGLSVSYQPNGNSSNYSIALSPGTYTISILAAAGYQSRPDTSVSITGVKVVLFPRIDLVPVYAADGARVFGAFLPVRVVTEVSLLRGTPFLRYAVNPDSAGKFLFANVVPGTYTLAESVPQTSGYAAPAATSLVVHANQPLDLGTTMLLADTSVFSYYVDDTLYRKEVLFSGSLASSRLTLKGSSFIFNAVTLSLTIEGFNGPGQYSCSVTGTIIQYEEPHNESIVAWSTGNPGGSGMISVTGYDPVAKKVSGTFFATVQSSGTTSTKVRKISRGVFTDRTYQ